MKKVAAYLCAAVILSLPWVAISADREPTAAMPEARGKVVAGTAVAESATVKAIDVKKRLITLVMSDGKEQTLAVDQAVQRLGEVQVGDTVNALYAEAVSVKINKEKVPPKVSVEQTLHRDEKASSPAGVAGVTLTTTATIDKIYDDGRKVNLKFPDGSSSDVLVRDPENLAKIKSGEVKEGDQIEITYRRALALSVEKKVQ